MDTAASVEGRLRALIQANEQLVSALDLNVVLRRVVELAIELSGAQYGALGVIAPSGKTLERFIYVGLDAAEATAIGHLPEGHGLLGAVIEDPEPIRIEDIGADIRSIGFPVHHPPMREFLGVPVHSKDTIFGNLYLTNRDGGFTASDQETVMALAATAGLAIENARLFAETTRRQAWTAASAEITAALLAGDQADPLQLLASRVVELGEAAVAVVMVPPPEVHAARDVGDSVAADRLVISAVAGAGWEASRGRDFPVEGTLAGRAYLSGTAQMAGESQSSYGQDRMLGPTMAVPLAAGETSLGVLQLAREPGSRAFGGAELQMAADFAAHASLAITLANARDTRQRMELVRDRGRIARELHDNVIQQIFGSGLELQGLLGTGLPESVNESVQRVTAQLDDAISQIRLAIFAMTATPANAQSLRHRVIDIVEQYRGGLPRAPRIDFRGALDSAVSNELADDVVAVVRESV